MIRGNKLYKKYGNKNVIEDVTIDIKVGKITSLIGPNGAGKSTLLSMMSRILKKDSGEVLIDSNDIDTWDNNELAKKLSILKQTNNSNMRLTIRELVSFGRFPHSKDKLTKEDEKFIDEAIEYMKLTDMQNKYIDQLSGGQKQRAYIAMVIAQDSEYIFLDEPLNNLDMKHSSQIMKILRKLVDDLGKTVVIVIHDINFASCYSDYIVALKDGKIEKQGKTHEIIDKKVLDDIYNMDFDIREINGNKICVYF